MPLPTASDVHINAALTNFAIRYGLQSFVALRALSQLPVTKMSDYFFKFNKGAWYRDEAGLRAPGSMSRGGGFPISSTTYGCKEWAWHDVVPDEVRDNADLPLKPDTDAVEFCMTKIFLRLEVLVATLLMTVSNWASGHYEDAEGGWTVGASSTFIADMEKGIKKVRSVTGFRPNKLVVDATTWSNIRQDEEVLDKIKYTQKGVVTPDLVASMFDLEEVLVGDAIKSTAEETAAGDDFTAADIWETNSGKGAAVLLYAPKAVSLKQPTAATIFRWTRPSLQGYASQAAEGSGGGVVGVRKWRDENIHSDIVEAFMDIDAKMTANDMGYLFYDTHTT